MHRHPIRRGLLALVVGVLLAGCIVSEPVVVRTPPPPPVVRVEPVPLQPGPAYVWVPGHWAWRRGGYVWLPGYWAVPAAPNYVWEPGHWAPGGGGYVWIEGRWRVR